MLSQQVIRRRSYLGTFIEDKDRGETKKRRQQPSKRNKLKMSPFPEVKGHTLKENRYSNLTEVKTSLQFTNAPSEEDELATAVTPTPTKAKKPMAAPRLSPAATFKARKQAYQRRSSGGVDSSSIAIKPSHLLEFQKHLATPQVKKTLTQSVTTPPQSARLAPERAAAVQQSGAVGTGEEEEGVAPVGIRSMWDSVVSLMKVAVEFISADEVADPIIETTDTPQAKKRSRYDDGSQPAGLPPAKLPRHSSSSGGGGRRGEVPRRRSGSFGKERGRSKRRMSFGGLRNMQRNSCSSGEGLGQLLVLEPIQEATSSPTEGPPFLLSPHSPGTSLAHNFTQSLSIKSPLLAGTRAPLQSSKVCSSKSLLSSARRCQPTNDGLNSILDGSPVPFPNQKRTKKVIRHTALKSFYGNSVDSPNLTELPPKQSDVKLPSAPPPPSPPPLPRHIPLPPPTPKLPLSPSSAKGGNTLEGCHGDGGGATTPHQSRDVLLKMQHRLRSRITKRGGGGIDKDAARLGAVSTPGGTSVVKVDIKVRQWAEIQAHSRRITLRQFLEMADQKKEEIEQTLQGLQSSTPRDLPVIAATVELLQDAFQWFPGGSREMKDTLPLYRKLEKKIEALNEFVQISSEMAAVCVLLGSDAPPPSSSSLPALLAHTREDFDTKHRHWGSVLLTGARCWLELGLPVCQTKLATARYHLCSLVEKHASLSLQEAAKITGILVSIKCVRTTQLKEKLRESLVFLTEARPYFTSATLPDCMCGSCCSDGGARRDVDQWRGHYSQELLLTLAAQVLLSYLQISSQQFDAFVCRSPRQEVCEHYEGVLKMLALVKSLVSSLTLLGRQRSKGIVPYLPESQKLGAALYNSCAGLIQHIGGQAQPFVSGLLSPHSKERTSKEVVLWMMFGCKYVNQTLEVLGSEQADERGVASLLGDLQSMEELLPE